jgi:dTDP-glucose 4,6-dehydratase
VGELVTGVDVVVRFAAESHVNRSIAGAADFASTNVVTAQVPLEPNSPYSASKAGSDLLARAYHCTHGLPVCVTRCSNNYGPYQLPEKVNPLFVTNLTDGRRVSLYGDGVSGGDCGSELTNRDLADAR